MNPLRLAAAALLFTACATTTYRIPSSSLATIAAQPARDADVEVTLEPVTDTTFNQYPQLSHALHWDETATQWGVPTRASQRDLLLPLVPLPSFFVTITNDGDEPLTLAASRIAIRDAAGGSHRVLTHVDDYLPRVVDRLVSQVPELWLRTQGLGPVSVWPPYLPWLPWTMPVEELRAAARTVPLLGEQVVIAPHAAWAGVMVVDVGAGSPAELAQLMSGSLRVSFAGLRTFEASFAGGGATPAAGACVATSEEQPLTPSLKRSRTVRFVGDARVTSADLDSLLVATPASRADAKKARALRIAGWTLVGAGLGGSGVAAGVIGSVSDSSYAPAGLSVLALSGVGAALLYAADRRETAAVREYNAFASATGACAAPDR